MGRDSKKLSEYLGRDLDELPNITDELWEQKIQMAILEPTYGASCEKIFRTMLKKGERNVLSLNIGTLTEETGLDSSTLLRIKSFLTKDIGLLSESEEEFSFVYGLSNVSVLLKRILGE